MFFRGLRTVAWGAVVLVFMLWAVASLAAPYAAMVMDARTGEVLHSRNADTRLHPASLTKMMTLYVVFDAVERGEIDLDTRVKISKLAASEPPSKIGLRAGQRIKLRYLIRAAAIKSANDAATALGEAISGSEAAFARRMNQTAKALGMTRTTFKNAHGLTEAGHLSTARDMTMMGRRLFFDFPQYYNIFKRRSADVGVGSVANTNRRFLSNYRGADGIKTGYTRAAGFNLVASAERGQERIITTVFGGRSTATRNAQVAKLMDLGFSRAPSTARIVALPEPDLGRGERPGPPKKTRPGKAVLGSVRPLGRPAEGPSEDRLFAMAESIDSAVADVQNEQTSAAINAAVLGALIPLPGSRTSAAETAETAAAEVESEPTVDAASEASAVQMAKARIVPRPRPAAPRVIAAAAPEPEPERVVVTRLSTSGGHHWGINVGRFTTRVEAERTLLRTALTEINMLDTALRKVASTPRGHDANFVGMTKEAADLACRRLQARNMECRRLGPAG